MATLLLTASLRAGPVLTELAGTRQVCSLGPDAALARARRQQGIAELTAANVLPNPSLVVQHSRTLSGVAERETVAGLSIVLGVSGSRGLSQAAARARREQAFAEADATLFESALDFREAYLTALFDQARADILSDQQGAFDATSATVEALAKSGEASGYDLLRQRVQARLHLGLLESALARALASRSSLEAWTEAEVTLPELDLSVLDTGSSLPPSSDIVSKSRRVQSLQAAARASALDARAARRRWVPNPEVFAGYRALDDGVVIGHGIALGVTVPLTFFDHGQGAAARAEAERELMSASAERLGREQRAEAKAARARLEQLSTKALDLGQARRDAHEVLTQAQRLYAAGEASITDLLEAFRGAEEARLGALERVFEIAQARLLLMRASGTMFDASLDQACLRPEPKKP